MEKKDKILVGFFIITGILFIIAGISFIFNNDYTRLYFSKDIINKKGRVLRSYERKADEYTKYIHINNPANYFAAKVTEDLDIYSMVIEVKNNDSTLNFQVDGVSNEDYRLFRRKGVNVIYDKLQTNIIAIDDWWFNLWPGIALITLGSSFIIFMIFMKWVLS